MYPYLENLIKKKFPNLNQAEVFEMAQKIINQVIDELDKDLTTQELVAKINLDMVSDLLSGKLKEIPQDKLPFWKELLTKINQLMEAKLK